MNRSLRVGGLDILARSGSRHGSGSKITSGRRGYETIIRYFERRPSSVRVELKYVLCFCEETGQEGLIWGF